MRFFEGHSASSPAMLAEVSTMTPNVKGSVAGRPRERASNRPHHSTRGRRRSTAAGGYLSSVRTEARIVPSELRVKSMRRPSMSVS